MFDYTQPKRILPKHRAGLAYRHLKHFLAMPLWTALWYIDEILYGAIIRKEKLVKPVFMMNQPRNGSTFFHRTLANHEHFFAIKHKEWSYPYVFLQLALDKHPWLKKVVYQDYWTGEAGKNANIMHQQDMESYEEDGVFFEDHVFFHAFNGLWNPFPQVLWYMGQFHKLPWQERRAMMAAHKRVIQKVQWLRKQSRPDNLKDAPLHYLSKENESWHRLPEMKALYPDAQFASIIRPPSESITSFAKLLKFSVMNKSGIDLEGDFDEVLAFRETFFRQKRIDALIHIDLFKNKLTDTKCAMIAFKLAIKHMHGSFQYILDSLDMEMTEGFDAYLTALLQKQKAKKVGGHEAQDERLYTGKGFDEFTAFELEVRAAHQQVLDDYYKQHPDKIPLEPASS